MGAELHESRRERSEERHWGDSPSRGSAEVDFVDSEEFDKEQSRDRNKHRSKDKKKSRSEVKDPKSRDKDRSKTSDGVKEREKEVKDPEKERISSKEKRKEERQEHEKDRTKDKAREKDHDRDKQRGRDNDREKDGKRKRDRERVRDKELEGDRDPEKEQSKEVEHEKENGKDRDRGKDRERGKDRDKTRDGEKQREHEKNRDRDMLDRGKDIDNGRDRERRLDHDKERFGERETSSRRNREDPDYRKDRGKDVKPKAHSDYDRDVDNSMPGKIASTEVEDSHLIKQEDYVKDSSAGPILSEKELEERILKAREERLKKKSDGASEILSWVNKSRKLEEKKKLEKQKAQQRSKMFEEQDIIDEDDEEAGTSKEAVNALAGIKLLHGIDKVVEGGSVVLTLKDQEILADGDVNENVDMLENVELGEQKRRNDAYKAAKKSASTYDDKFNDQPGEEKKMLPQYDDQAEEEGVTLDVAGRFTSESEKKLEELRRRLEGPSLKNQVEDLNPSVRISSDYYTADEMLQFRKPKKKKSLRKKDKLDIDALEAEARAEGLGASDLGSRNNNRQAAREEEERAEAERRSNAYLSAFAKADEASRALRMEQALAISKDEEDTEVFADDAEDLQKSLERARKLALKKQNQKTLSGPEAIARLATSAVSSQPVDAQNSTSGDASDNKVVFTEMEEFVWGLQLDEESQKPNNEDVFMDEDEAPKAYEEKKDVTAAWTEAADSVYDEQVVAENKEEIVPDDTIHEAPVGKGLSGVLKLLKERGTLKETIEWGGRNMDKKKSKLVGIYDEEGPKKVKEIHLEKTDEYGRILTPKEAFRLLSHKFHGKGPGKMKQEKRMKQYYDEQKLKQMTSSDVLPQSVERMREAQSQLKTPYLVLSGHVKPGQTSDPRSGFATVEKETPGSLTPMLGDKKVEHFLGIKRKAEPGSSGTPKKPHT